MSIDQILFWILSAAAIPGAILVSRKRHSLNAGSKRWLSILNHLLLLLLPFVVVLHGLKYLDFLEVSDGILFWERVLFPVYLWALLTHIILNWEFFRKVPHEN